MSSNVNEYTKVPIEQSNGDNLNQQDIPPPYLTNITNQTPLIHEQGTENPVITTPPGPGPVLISQPGILMLENRGLATILCPYENIPVLTEISYKPGIKAGLWSIGTCFVFWPLFWVPLVTNKLKEEIHTCPSCKRVLAIA